MDEAPAPTTAPEPAPAPRSRAASRWFRAKHEVLWLVLVALAVRAAAAWTNPAILNDSAALLRAAERVGRDGLAAALAGPDHPLAPWLISRLGGPFGMEVSATALCVLAGAFAVWPLHVLARRACGRHAATGACILYAALPKAIGVTTVPLTTGLALPLFLAALSLAIAASTPCSARRRSVRLVSAGLMGGAAYLCRPEGLIAGAAAVLLAVVLTRHGRRLVSGAIVAAAFVAVALPYAAVVTHDAGHFSLSPKKDVWRVVGIAETPAPARDTSAVVRDVASSLDGALTAPVLVLALAGILSWSRWRHRRSMASRAAVLAVAAGLIALVVRLQTGWGYGGARHALLGALLLLPFAGEGLHLLGGFISRVVARRRLAVVLASFLAIPLAVKAILRPVGEDMEDARRLGEALATEIGPAPGGDAAIATFAEPLVAYYADRSLAAAGGRVRDLPLWGAHRGLLERADAEGQRAALVATLRGGRARWLVLDLFETTTRPTGETACPGRRLAECLTQDGVLGTPVVSAGGTLVAFPVR